MNSPFGPPLRPEEPPATASAGDRHAVEAGVTGHLEPEGMVAICPGVVRVSPTLERDRPHLTVISEHVAQFELGLVQEVGRRDVMWIGGGPGDAKPGKQRRGHPHGFGTDTAGGAPGDIRPLRVYHTNQAEDPPIHASLAVRIA